MEPYTDQVMVVGEVRAVELNDDGSGTFRLRLEDGDGVTGDFTDYWEAVITNVFRNHKWTRLVVKGEGKFDQAGVLRHILRVDSCRIIQPGESPNPPVSTDPKTNVGLRMIQMADEIIRKYPDTEEDEKLPSDFATNYKHYFYGYPKE